MPNIFLDERIARSYDADSTEMFDPAVLDPAIDFLAGLAAGSNALELGIGTGRVALPLSRRGVTVHGIDISPAMIAELRAKPGAEAIGVTMGDYATAVVGTTFRLAYAPFNAITNLMTQAEQAGCFRNMANHLEDGGYFVAEVFVPEVANHVPHVRISWDAAASGRTAADVVKTLRDGEPSIGIRAEEETVVVGVWMMRPGEEKVVARRLRQVLEKKA